MGEHTTYLEWLDQELEGTLPAEAAGQLADHLAECAGCRHERRHLVRLHEALDEATIPLREGFHAGVMAALPAAPWQRATRRRGSYRLAAALLVALAGLSAALLALAGAEVAPGAPLAAAASAVVDLLAVSLVAGAGLLAASWSGVGLAVGEIFSASPGILVGCALLLTFLVLLLATMVRRPRTAAARSPRHD